ncbi:GTP cyclohydrolase II [Azospirillum sp. ST 5-10]|uniref:GTP cyclohydrolase II n=1 Tax=unclassified Azospirillum TaxID=2630922 RepID=UPI003F49CF4D
MYADLQPDPPHPVDEAAMRTVDRVLAALRRGEPVAVEAEDGSCALVLAVEMLEAESLARLKRLAGGDPVLAVTRRRAAMLGLPAPEDGAVALTLAAGLRADEALRLADPEQQPAAALPAGLAAAAAAPGSAAAAAVDLAKVARLLPAAVVVPVRGLRGSAGAWAARHDVLAARARDVADYRVHVVRTLRRVAEARVPLEGAEDARVVAFRPADGGPEFLAIVIGDPSPDRPVLARLHSECFTGDLLGSLRCDCGEQLRGAITEIARAGGGVLLYLAQEGRGIGLVNKLRAYRIQDRGFDTVDANEMLGFEADERVYLPAAEMLRQLRFTAVRLMTNNPDKLHQLARCGIEVVERVPHVFPSNAHNEGYLRTKAERSGHLF